MQAPVHTPHTRYHTTTARVIATRVPAVQLHLTDIMLPRFPAAAGTADSWCIIGPFLVPTDGFDGEGLEARVEESDGKLRRV